MNVSSLLVHVSRLAACIALAPVAFSQAVVPATTPDRSAGKESAIELSPFVISETTETGWIATETLAGSRLRTNFKDVPNQIETLTKDFMADLGLNSVEQALIYTATV
jgi:hypothetical protein